MQRVSDENIKLILAKPLWELTAHSFITSVRLRKLEFKRQKLICVYELKAQQILKRSVCKTSVLLQ